MNKVFQIGDFVFRLIADEKVIPPPNFMLFESGAIESVQYTYTIRLSEDFPEISGKITAQRYFLRSDAERTV